MKHLLLILLSAAILDNCVPLYCLGARFAADRSDHSGGILSLSAVATLVLLLSAAALWPLTQLLTRFNAGYWLPFLFVLIAVAAAQLVKHTIATRIPAFLAAAALDDTAYTAGCVLLCACLLSGASSFASALFSALGVGAGLCVTLYLFDGIAESLESSDAPKSFQGLPLLLISAGILAAACCGFSGVFPALLG